MERLQKIISAAGICSRRAAEKLLAEGRVTVNGVTAGVGDKADPGKDEILIDHVTLKVKPRQLYLMLNKPRGYVTTLSDEKGRKTVYDLVRDCGERVWPVGRLDLDSDGLLLMTNDGTLTNGLTHPSHEVEKEYLVRVRGEAEQAVPILRQPMTLDGVTLRPAKIKMLEDHLLSVIIHEGKNRQVRRMCAAAGLQVVKLTRIREGNLTLGGLETGRWRRLSTEEINDLMSML